MQEIATVIALHHHCLHMLWWCLDHLYRQFHCIHRTVVDVRDNSRLHVGQVVNCHELKNFESLTETTWPMPLFDVARVFLPNCCSLSKQDDSASLGMRWGWIPHSTLTEPSEYQLAWTAERLEASPWSPTTHLASFCGSRLAASQPWPECCMATCSESNTLDALHGECYAPVRGMLLMMMMMMMNAGCELALVVQETFDDHTHCTCQCIYNSHFDVTVECGFVFLFNAEGKTCHL